jgi:serine/threonine-protein kinase
MESGLREKGNSKVAARIMTTVACAVYFAHQHGILHRALWPANILLDRGGRPHVSGVWR